MEKENIQENADQSVETGGQQVHTENKTKTFTQEDVNGLVAKESKKAQEKILKELGIEDFDTAKDGLVKFKEWQESQKTEAEKQKEDLANKDKELATEKELNRTLNAKIHALSAGVLADSVDDVVTLASKLTTDDVTIEEAIKQVVEKYPQFVQKTEAEQTTPKFTTGGNPIGTTNDVTNAFEEKLNKYK